MNRPWKALAFLAAVAGTALVLSTSALAIGGGARPASAAQWRTSLGPDRSTGRLTALYPGAADDSEVFSITVTNAGRAVQSLRSVIASVRVQDGRDVGTVAGADIPGCRASWFRVSIARASRALPARIAPGASYTASLELAMRNSATNQDACRGAAPAFTVTAR